MTFVQVSGKKPLIFLTVVCEREVLVCCSNNVVAWDDAFLTLSLRTSKGDGEWRVICRVQLPTDHLSAY